MYYSLASIILINRYELIHVLHVRLNYQQSSFAPSADPISTCSTCSIDKHGANNFEQPGHIISAIHADSHPLSTSCADGRRLHS